MHSVRSLWSLIWLLNLYAGLDSSLLLASCLSRHKFLEKSFWFLHLTNYSFISAIFLSFHLYFFSNSNARPFFSPTLPCWQVPMFRFRQKSLLNCSSPPFHFKNDLGEQDYSRTLISLVRAVAFGADEVHSKPVISEPYLIYYLSRQYNEHLAGIAICMQWGSNY